MFMTIVFDTSVTLIIRIAKKRKVWEAHKEHEYQKLHQILNSQPKVIAIAYIQTIICVILGFLYIYSDKQKLRLYKILIISIKILGIKYWWIYN